MVPQQYCLPHRTAHVGGGFSPMIKGPFKHGFVRASGSSTVPAVFTQFWHSCFNSNRIDAKHPEFWTCWWPLSKLPRPLPSCIIVGDAATSILLAFGAGTSRRLRPSPIFSLTDGIPWRQYQLLAFRRFRLMRVVQFFNHVEIGTCFTIRLLFSSRFTAVQTESAIVFVSDQN